MADRFLEDHRQPIADYDRIRFDESEIRSLRERLNVASELRVHWTWDYVKEVESLRALYERGKTAQWNVETDLDWSLDVPRDKLVFPIEHTIMGPLLQMMGADEATVISGVRDELEHGISQLLHGEQAALLLTAQIANGVNDMDTKLFAGQQVADECRHVEAFAKLLARKFECIHPIDPNIKFLLDEMVEAKSWHFKIVGMQMLFEGVAMAVLTDIGTHTPNALIKDTMRYVARDEARHAAFGVLSMREELAKMTAEDRERLEVWTWKVLEVVANGLMSGTIDYLAAKYKFDAENVAGMAFSSPQFWDARYNLFNHTVLPNLKRLGIISERTRSYYDQFRLFDAAPPNGAAPLPQGIQ